MYLPEVHDKNCLVQLLRSSDTCLYIPLTTKECNFQLGMYCNSVSCSACICLSSCSVTALSVSAACALACTTCKTFWKPTTMHCHSWWMCHSFPSAHRCTDERSSLPLGTYFAVPLISSLPLDTVSIIFATPLPILTNIFYYMVLTVEYYTQDCWVSGLLPLSRSHKKTQNFSKWICSCIQVKGTYSFTWTFQPFSQTQISKCLPIISSDRNKLMQFPEHCSKYRFLAVFGIYVVFPGT